MTLHFTPSAAPSSATTLDNTTVTCLAHDGKGRSHNVEGASQMNIQHCIEVGLCHFLQGCRADDAGVMDENVNTAVMVQRRPDDGAAALGGSHRRGASGCFAPRGPDLSRHLFCGPGIKTTPV